MPAAPTEPIRTPGRESDGRHVPTAVIRSEPRRGQGPFVTRSVVALTDRVWFKVKTSEYRAAVTEFRGADLPDWVRPSRGGWWIGAAGQRQADSTPRDYHAALQRECTTGRTVSSDHLLPADWT